MKIRILGCSGGGVTLKRNLPSLIVDDCILFDCGEGTLHSLYIYNIPLSKIKAIFITHTHADHFLGLISFVYKWAFYLGLKKSPKIYFPVGSNDKFIKILELTSTTGGLERTGFELRTEELPLSMGSHSPIKIETQETASNTYKISWCQTDHDPPCLGYRVEDNMGKFLLYSGDSGPSEEFSEFSKNGDLLIHEASLPDFMKDFAHRVHHSTPSDVATMAKISGIKQVVLTHLPDFNNEQLKKAFHISNDDDLINDKDDKNDKKDKDDKAVSNVGLAYIKNARKIFGNITLAEDGMEIIIE